MKKIILAVVAVTLMAGSSHAADKKLAARYLEIVPIRSVVESTLISLFRGDKRRVAGIVGRMDFSTINRILVDKIASNFSNEELKAAISYHSSPEGRSFTRKMPLVIDSVAPQLQEQIQKALIEDPAL